MTQRITLSARVTDALSGKRLDQAAAGLFPEYSRSRLQGWIESGSLRVNGEARRSRDKVFSDDQVCVDAELSAEQEWAAEPMPLHVVYEDDSLLVLNKQAGAVVHPAAGHRAGTLVNGLLHHCPQLELVPRAGIVHRLDKDTTGLMVVAKTLQSHASLVSQLQARTVSREYEAVIVGVLTAGGTVDLPLGRHPVQRKKQAVLTGGKEARTHYRVIRKFQAHTHVGVKLETGRTHQIRVHFAHLHYPLVGDKVYGGRLRIPQGCSAKLSEILRQFNRQALHARRLELIHPRTGEKIAWDSDLPADMQELLRALEEDSQQ